MLTNPMLHFGFAAVLLLFPVHHECLAQFVDAFMNRSRTPTKGVQCLQNIPYHSGRGRFIPAKLERTISSKCYFAGQQLFSDRWAKHCSSSGNSGNGPDTKSFARNVFVGDCLAGRRTNVEFVYTRAKHVCKRSFHFISVPALDFASGGFIFLFSMAQSTTPKK